MATIPIWYFAFVVSRVNDIYKLRNEFIFGVGFGETLYLALKVYASLVMYVSIRTRKKTPLLCVCAIVYCNVHRLRVLSVCLSLWGYQAAVWILLLFGTFYVVRYQRIAKNTKSQILDSPKYEIPNIQIDVSDTPLNRNSAMMGKNRFKHVCVTFQKKKSIF